MAKLTNPCSTWGLLSRVGAGIFGGYALASAWVVLCGAADAARVQGIVLGMQTSWVWYAAAIIWAFSPVALAKVWAVLCASVLLMLSLALALARIGVQHAI